jgi:imidazolonepropionase
VTRNAARAAGRPDAGVLAPGRPGDLVVWAADDHRTIPYHYGANHVAHVVIAGRGETLLSRRE